MSKFNVGDRVILVEDKMADGNSYEGSVRDGEEAVITRGPDSDGDYRIEAVDDAAANTFVGPDYILPMPKVGDKVIVTGDTAGWGHCFKAGTEGVAVRASSNGNRTEAGFRVEGEDDYWYVAARDLRLVKCDPCPRVEAAPKASVGTATLKVEVRFFIGDVDVTTQLKTLFT